MRKSEFVAEVAKQAGSTHAETEKILNAMEPVLVKAVIENGEEVSFGFGKFRQKLNAAKTGINPLTKKPINKPASKTISFKASKTIKQEA